MTTVKIIVGITEANIKELAPPLGDEELAPPLGAEELTPPLVSEEVGSCVLGPKGEKYSVLC